MRLEITLRHDRIGRAEEHVVVLCEPDATVGSVLEQAGIDPETPCFLNHQQLLRKHTIEDSELVSGCTIEIGRPLPARRSSVASCVEPTEWHLAIIGGSNAGLRFPLGLQPVTIGRSEQCDVVLDDPSVSKEHARVMLAGNDVWSSELWQLTDLGSKNGTIKAGEGISNTTELRPGEPFSIGASVLEVRRSTRTDANVQRDEEGTRTFNRPARIRLSFPTHRIRIPSRPSENEPWPFPFAQVLAPLVLAGAMLLIFKRPEALLFGLLSPVIGVSSWSTNRRRNKRRAALTDAKYDAEIEALRNEVSEFHQREVFYLQDSFPDPSTVGLRAELPTQRLWERRLSDSDSHTLRVGLKTRDSSVEIDSSERNSPIEPPTIHDAPVGVDLAAVGVLGIAGPESHARALARWVILQLCVHRSPDDLQLVLLTQEDAPKKWAWWRWLPHSRMGDGALSRTLAGIDVATREARLQELLALIDARLAERRNQRDEGFRPTVVVVVDGARALRALSGFARLLQEGPRVGVYAVAFDSDPSQLPAEGKARIVLDSKEPWLGTLAVDEVDSVSDILLDGVNEKWCDSIARSLASIRCAGSDESSGAIPLTARLVDLVGIDLDSPDGGASQISAGWVLNGRSTEVLIGVGSEGKVSLDLRRDGPHTLVAGTTGAGKSELLQTMVASLAIASTPTALSFVLVDYKGESAFGECAQLPHTVGILSNLDSHRTARALVHLEAELKRRERVLRQLGAPDVDAAWERNPAEAAGTGLARLVLIVDEFAELVHELPDFISGLVRIARVGRSLGIHLVLATQRPTGVITPEMKANTGLRIAMRMVDKGESSEVLERPDAASISPATPGRAFARTGGHTGLIPFQTARVAGRRRGVQVEVPTPKVHSVPWSKAPYPLRLDAPAAVPGATTDLSALVAAIRSASDQTETSAPRSPLVRELSSLLTLEELNATARTETNGVAIGIEDHPLEQKQVPCVFYVEQGEHLLLIGSSRTGRSTALRTVATALAQRWAPDDLHIYGLDFGNGGLNPLSLFPHCGAIVGRSESDRIERLLLRVAAEVARRQELLTAGGFGDITEQRRTVSPSERLAYFVLFIDRWEGFTSMFSAESASELPAIVLRLIRESASVGLRIVVAGDRSLLTDRIASHVETKLAFRLADRNDYRLIGVTPSNVAEQIDPGRAVHAESGIEVQFAIPIRSSDQSEPAVDTPEGLQQRTDQQAQAAYIKELAAGISSASHNPPFRVDVLPGVVTLEQARSLTPLENAENPNWATVGVGGDSLTAIGVSFDAMANSFVVGGPSRSGRSSTLLAMTESLMSHVGAHEFLVVCPRPSVLTAALSGRAGITIAMGPFSPESITEAITEAFTEAFDTSSPKKVLIIDDIDAIPPGGDVDNVLRAFVRDAVPGSVALIVAGLTDEIRGALRGTAVDAKRSKRALLLSPTSTLDGDLVGERIPRNFLGRAPAGRGVFLLEGQIGFLQVPKVV
jgi:DNA segregation ATPase FtsK/SpoIIIE, S-DNA-T family